jgi:hypothetical protein
VVLDHARHQFARWNRIRDMPSVTIAMPDVPYYVDKIRELLPRAKLHLVQDIGLIFSEWRAELDAVAIPAERGSAWTLRYPQFSVVVPEPGIIKVPLAYPIGRHDAAFASFMNTWIDLKRKGRNNRDALQLLEARTRRGTRSASLARRERRPALGRMRQSRPSSRTITDTRMGQLVINNQCSRNSSSPGV